MCESRFEGQGIVKIWSEYDIAKVIGYLFIVFTISDVWFIIHAVRCEDYSSCNITKITRYCIGLKTTIIFLEYPMYIGFVFFNCGCCTYSSYLFASIPSCFVLMTLFSLYIFFIDEIKSHKYYVQFYVVFFVAQAVLYLIVLCFILYKLTNWTKYELPMIHYTYLSALLLIPCCLLSFESVFIFQQQHGRKMEPKSDRGTTVNDETEWVEKSFHYRHAIQGKMDGMESQDPWSNVKIEEEFV